MKKRSTMNFIEECEQRRARLLNEAQLLDKVLHELAILKSKKSLLV